MKPNQASDDLMEQALKAMLDTVGTDQPPATVVSQVRQAITERQKVGMVARPAPDTHPDRVSWLALAATLLLMVTCGGILGFHRRLFSEVAGQQLAANGARYVIYTDGRVKVVKSDAGKP